LTKSGIWAEINIRIKVLIIGGAKIQPGEHREREMKFAMMGALALGCLATSAAAQVEIKVASIAPAGTPWVAQLEAWEKMSKPQAMAR
jgi:hypothetical protein